jgi:dienelactone hydrolase
MKSSLPEGSTMTKFRNTCIALAATFALMLECSAQTSSGAATPASAPASAAAPAPIPFAQQFNTLPNGIEARNVSFASANPNNYEEIMAHRQMPAVTLEAKLYMPKGAAAKVPAVIITPGSGGINPFMQAHARGLTDAGIAVLMVDPFGGRGVRDTISAQDQFSFAASTYDIFAAMRWLAGEAAIDSTRLGAMGYSRGGISVLQAAITPLAQAALGGAKPLRAVLAGWPWCGYQFADPQTAPTSVRFVSGDADDYVSSPQCQGYASAMKPRNPDVSFRLVRDARHGFGYGAPLRELPQAMKALMAPAVYFDAQGVLLDPWSQAAMPGLDDRAVVKMLTPFITRGVNVGSKEGQMQDFVADLVAYFSAKLK